MTTAIYKLTAQDLTTHGGFLWQVGQWYQNSGEEKICGAGWFHSYTDPLLAVFMNPVHAWFKNPRLWRGEARGKMLDGPGLKQGWTEMRILEELDLPEFSKEQRIRAAIYCVQEVIGDEFPAWSTWASRWLSGEDRSATSAGRAAVAAGKVVWQSMAAGAAGIALRAVWVTEEAGDLDWSAAAAAETVWSAAMTKTPLDLVSIIKRAMEDEK